MMFSDVLQRFVDQKPVCVMVRAVLEHVFSAARLDDIFARTAQQQYTKELAFSTCAQLLSQVTLGSATSVHAAFKKDQARIPVSIVALYEKLQHVECGVCEQLVAQTFQPLADTVQDLQAERPEPIRGYRLRMLDGNLLAGTEHRLKVLRGSGAAALPGMSLVWYEYRSGLISALVAWEDAHTNERKLLPRVQTQVQAGDLVLADRNFCTADFLAAIVHRRAAFLIRHHASLKLHATGPRRKAGRCRTGTIFEQAVHLSSGLACRAIVIERDTPLRSGGKRVILLTNVPRSKASAEKLAWWYLKRWTIEEAFRQLTEYLSCEVRTLGYPKAALLAFTLAVLAYNCLGLVRGALASVHGRERVDKELSSFYLACEVKSTYEGMAVAVPAQEWQTFAHMERKDFVRTLRTLASKVIWSRYTKNPRGPKKPVQRQKVQRGYHVATARLLQKQTNPTSRAKGACPP